MGLSWDAHCKLKHNSRNLCEWIGFTQTLKIIIQRYRLKHLVVLKTHVDRTIPGGRVEQIRSTCQSPARLTVYGRQMSSARQMSGEPTWCQSLSYLYIISDPQNNYTHIYTYTCMIPLKHVTESTFLLFLCNTVNRLASVQALVAATEVPPGESSQANGKEPSCEATFR